MKSSTRRLLVILASFGLIFGSFFVYFSLIVPTYQEIQKLRAELYSKQALYGDQQRAEEAVGKLVGQFQGLATFQELVSISLPRQADIPSILNQLQGIARLSQISLQSLSFQYLPLPQPKDALIQPIGVIRVNINLFGSYTSLKSYISALETNVRVIDLSSLKIDGGARANQANLIHNIIVDVYYQS